MSKSHEDESALSFMANSDQPGPFGHYINYWSPMPTGDMAADQVRGRELANEALSACKLYGNSRAVLFPMLEMHMRGIFSGLEIGFLSEIADAARRGRMN